MDIGCDEPFCQNFLSSTECVVDHSVPRYSINATSAAERTRVRNIHGEHTARVTIDRSFGLEFQTLPFRDRCEYRIFTVRTRSSVSLSSD